MLKKTIQCEDLNGNAVTKEAFFNLNKFEIAKLDVEYEDARFVDKDGKELTGTQAVIQDIIENPKGKKILAFIENLVQKSYGEKKGDFLDKSPETVAAFIYSDAYSELILSFVNDTEELTSFIAGILPKKVMEEAAKIEKSRISNN